MQVFGECARILRRGGFLAFEIDGKWELDMLLHDAAERARARAARGVGHVRVWRDIPCKTFTDRELRADLAAAGLRVASVRGVNILHCLLPASVLMGLPREVGAGWRAVSSMLQGLDGMVARLPWLLPVGLNSPGGSGQRLRGGNEEPVSQRSGDSDFPA